LGGVLYFSNLSDETLDSAIKSRFMCIGMDEQGFSEIQENRSAGNSVGFAMPRATNNYIQFMKDLQAVMALSYFNRSCYGTLPITPKSDEVYMKCINSIVNYLERSNLMIRAKHTYADRTKDVVCLYASILSDLQGWLDYFISPIGPGYRKKFEPECLQEVSKHQYSRIQAIVLSFCINIKSFESSLITNIVNGIFNKLIPINDIVSGFFDHGFHIDYNINALNNNIFLYALENKSNASKFGFRKRNGPSKTITTTNDDGKTVNKEVCDVFIDLNYFSIEANTWNTFTRHIMSHKNSVHKEGEYGAGYSCLSEIKIYPKHALRYLSQTDYETFSKRAKSLYYKRDSLTILIVKEIQKHNQLANYFKAIENDFLIKTRLDSQKSDIQKTQTKSDSQKTKSDKEKSNKEKPTNKTLDKFLNKYETNNKHVIEFVDANLSALFADDPFVTDVFMEFQSKWISFSNPDNEAKIIKITTSQTDFLHPSTTTDLLLDWNAFMVYCKSTRHGNSLTRDEMIIKINMIKKNGPRGLINRIFEEITKQFCVHHLFDDIDRKFFHQIESGIIHPEFQDAFNSSKGMKAFEIETTKEGHIFHIHTTLFQANKKDILLKAIKTLSQYVTLPKKIMTFIENEIEIITLSPKSNTVSIPNPIKPLKKRKYTITDSNDMRTDNSLYINNLGYQLQNNENIILKEDLDIFHANLYFERLGINKDDRDKYLDATKIEARRSNTKLTYPDIPMNTSKRSILMEFTRFHTERSQSDDMDSKSNSEIIFRLGDDSENPHKKQKHNDSEDEVSSNHVRLNNDFEYNNQSDLNMIHNQLDDDTEDNHNMTNESENETMNE
jgi:hypothetical protein